MFVCHLHVIFMGKVYESMFDFFHDRSIGIGEDQLMKRLGISVSVPQETSVNHVSKKQLFTLASKQLRIIRLCK
jgi:hypothetical protein